MPQDKENVTKLGYRVSPRVGRKETPSILRTHVFWLPIICLNNFYKIISVSST